MFDTKTIDFEKASAALGVRLSALDVSGSPGTDRVAVMRARARVVAHFEAQLLADMVSVADAMGDVDGIDDELVFDAAAAEVAAALCLTRRTAEERLVFALALRRRIPAVWRSLAEGAIDVRRAQVIERGTAHLDEAEARRVAEAVLADAVWMTTGQLRARLRRVCIETNPGDADERYRASVADRRVVVEPTSEGTADLFALNLPPDRVQAARARIDHLAKRLRRPGETRTMDQLRADVLLDLLDGSRTATGGTVEIRVDLTTLADLEQYPGDLAGYGPVVAEIARDLTERLGGGAWRYVAIHPDSGLPVASGVVRRRPNARQRRGIYAAHSTCVFPGCRMPAADCDLDHTVAWSQGGPTTTDNLAPLCRHHHRLKDFATWRYVPRSNGDYLWISPFGHTYTTSGQSP